MSDKPNAEVLKNGVRGLAEAINAVKRFASTLDQAEMGGGIRIDSDIVRFCIELSQPDQPLSKLLAILCECTEAAKILYAYPEYERQARYCIKTSLQAAESGSSAMEFANKMEKQIRMLYGRAEKRGSNKWTASHEREFWQRHTRLDYIAGTYNINPRVPDHGESIPPVREVTDIDRILRNYLMELERIPQYHRTILDRLDKMSREMVHKYYKDQVWYKDAAK